MTFKTLAIFALVSVATLGQAAVIWDETLQGDLSGNHLIPDDLFLSNGSNELIGTTGESDRDYFHFSLAAGQSITAIIVQDYVSGDDISFLAVQEGTFITEDPESPNVENLLGWGFFGTPQIGLDILPAIGTGGGAIGFTPPLTGSDYAFWLQQTGDPTSYTLNFVVVPEPCTLLVTGGLVGLMAARRKRKAAR